MGTIYRIRIIATDIIANLVVLRLCKIYVSITPLVANAVKRQQLVSVRSNRMPNTNGMFCEFITGSMNNDAQLSPIAYTS